MLTLVLVHQQTSDYSIAMRGHLAIDSGSEGPLCVLPKKQSLLLSTCFRVVRRSSPRTRAAADLSVIQTGRKGHARDKRTNGTAGATWVLPRTGGWFPHGYPQETSHVP